MWAAHDRMCDITSGQVGHLGSPIYPEPGRLTHTDCPCLTLKLLLQGLFLGVTSNLLLHLERKIETQHPFSESYRLALG